MCWQHKASVRQLLCGWIESNPTVWQTPQWYNALKANVDIAWLNCGARTMSECWQKWESSPRKAHNHGEPISADEMKLTSSLRVNRDTLWKLLQPRLILRRPDRSLHTRWASQVHYSGTSKVWNIAMYKCTKGRYLSLSLHPQKATGPRVLFSGIQLCRHSSLDLRGV